ncbi:MAG: Orf2 family protein [Chthoniobacteraceae bacterium]|nr:Orf2 family protein [Chthoniobacteraceae bacterium]
MISLGAATRVFLACGVTDMRKGYDGLYGLVKIQLEEDPLSGHLFVFANRQRTRLKILYFDGTGLWICGKRLERGRFKWPVPDEPAQGKVRLSAAELAMLLGGIDLKGTKERKWFRKNE